MFNYQICVLYAISLYPCGYNHVVKITVIFQNGCQNLTVHN